MFIDDPLEKKMSLANKKPAICNGEKTGMACKHYHLVVVRHEVSNPASMKLGAFHRLCHLSQGYPLEFNTEDMPVECSRYKKSKDKKHKWEKMKVLEEYQPMTEEEVKELYKKIDEVRRAELNQEELVQITTRKNNKNNENKFKNFSEAKFEESLDGLIEAARRNPIDPNRSYRDANASRIYDAIDSTIPNLNPHIHMNEGIGDLNSDSTVFDDDKSKIFD